jgi:pyruvate/2-oxoglutarate dehydrogenase complex dihydrolipoamide acyltransferase (E2) component
VTVSADHRVTDGVGAAELVVEVKRLLENPILLLLDPSPVRAAAP